MGDVSPAQIFSIDVLSLKGSVESKYFVLTLVNLVRILSNLFYLEDEIALSGFWVDSIHFIEIKFNEINKEEMSTSDLQSLLPYTLYNCFKLLNYFTLCNYGDTWMFLLSILVNPVSSLSTSYYV